MTKTVTPTVTPEVALEITKQVYTDILLNTHIMGTTRQAFIEQTIVAGGAIRDSIYNKPIHDIDIFVTCGSGSHPDVSRWAHDFWDDLGFTKMASGHGSFDEENSFYVRENNNYAVPVQLIFSKHKTPQEIIKQFPVSISRCYWSPLDNKIHTSNTFKEYEKTKTIYYNWNRATMRLDGPEAKYIEKIVNRYPQKEGNEWINIS